MSIINKLLTKIKTIPKHIMLLVLLGIVIITAIGIPTLARYKNRIDIESVLNNTNVWNGTIADRYHKGTGSDTNPFIISNAEEFAYFKEQLKTTDYKDTYFKLSNDIVINNGLFSYDNNNKIMYTLNESTFYIKEYTTDFYDNIGRTGTKIASINSFESLNNFKGHLDGDYYRIYGLYITNETEDELSLFKNVEGTIKNLYLENTMIYGGNKTSSLINTTSNTLIENVFTSGNVVSTKSDGTDTLKLSLDKETITKTNENYTSSLFLPEIPVTEILSISLKGKYTSTENDQKIKINEKEITPGEFTLDLETTPLEEIEIKIEDNKESEITLDNLIYEITYKHNVTSGVISEATNTTISNVINKTNVFGIVNSTGLVGKLNNSTIEKSYNTGKISASKVASGLIDTIRNGELSNINECYNAGELSGSNTIGIINKIYNVENVIIENTFNATDVSMGTSHYTINSIDSPVHFSNVLDVLPTGIKHNNNTAIKLFSTEDLSGSISSTTIEELKNKTYMIETLSYNEFIDNNDLSENNDNVWVYEKKGLPILYIDDLNNPVATLHVGTYTWNDLGYELSKYRFSTTPAFSIEEVDQLVPLEEILYYIHNDKTPLTRKEIEEISNWTKYENIEKLPGEGNYIIYVKTKDKDGYISYINSEHLIVDLTSPKVTLKMNNKTWDSLRKSLKTTNISETSTLTLTSTDEYSDITEQSYYISSSILSEDELKELSSSNWKKYEDNIKVSTKGVYVINVKVKDEANHITYVNSDYISFSGYEEKISIGRNNKEQEEINITDKSLVSYNFTYKNNITYQEGYTNNLITNILLPKGTAMTLINNKTKEKYYYKVETTEDEYNYEKSCTTDNCDKYATYPLSLFKLIGENNKTFDDNKYLNSEEKDLTLLIDFKDSNIDKNLSLTTKLQLKDSSDEIILSTLKDTIKTVNIYNDLKYNVSITKLNNPPVINYNSDSSTNIELKVNITDPTHNEKTVIDTNLENKKTGIVIKLIDSDNKIVPKEKLKNIEFKIGETSYSPNSDGLTRIKLSNEAISKNITISIITHEADINLGDGNYKFVITPFVSADGKYTNNLSTNSITTSLTTVEKSKKEYNFNVIGSESDKVISKKIPTTTMRFKIINSLDNSKVRISLYKRNTFNPLDQTYSLIDLKSYTTTELNEVEGIEDVYSIDKDEFNLTLNTTKFDYTGYELRFELYDGLDKLTTIKKKFIVR